MIPLLNQNTPKGYIEVAVRKGFGESDEHCYVNHKHGLRILISVDGGKKHLSISHQQRYPTWEEILEARNWYFPEEMEVIMVLARKSEYVNFHSNCFHLWESLCGQEGR